MAKRDTKSVMKIDAGGIFYRELNARLREIVSNGTRRIMLRNVYGQRYIGTDLTSPSKLRFSVLRVMT